VAEGSGAGPSWRAHRFESPDSASGVTRQHDLGPTTADVMQRADLGMIRGGGGVCFGSLNCPAQTLGG
jgi:hypothetical protein